jgi:hypothetical protein
MNKHVTNKILIHNAGKKIGHSVILSHTGCKPGNLYKPPIIAEPVEGGFVIALIYGRKADWLANVLAKGGRDLIWKQQDFHLMNPEVIDREKGLKAFPTPINKIMRLVGIEFFLMLSIKL